MKNRMVRYLIPAAILGMSVVFTGCGSSSNTYTPLAAAVVSADAGTTTNSAETEDEWYSDRDLEQAQDLSEATTIEVTDGQTIDITEEGTYILTGEASDCTVFVNAPEAKIQLILDGVSITNTSSPAIYVLDADKCFVTTAEGSTNALAVTGTFTSDTENDVNTDAVIFAKADLTLNGLGTLSISSSKNGITSKDEMTVTGGTYNITVSGKGLESNDSLAICDGTLSISATEGIESTYIRIDGGTIAIDASDDGMNATSNSDKYSVLVEINDGNISINMGAGDTDGIDSNGDLIINGGTVNVNGNSAYDFDGTGSLNGGTVTANGQAVTELTGQMMGGHGGGMGGRGGWG